MNRMDVNHQPHHHHHHVNNIHNNHAVSTANRQYHYDPNPHLLICAANHHQNDGRLCNYESCDSNYSLLTGKPTNNNQTAIRNLRLRMHEIHLAYINNNDEYDKKIELRKRLECLIDEYLIVVRHDDKFTFREFRDCLEITCKKSNFDPEKAIEAFRLVERYALNLLNYPWRHEYHKIFAFGYYRIIKYSLSGHCELMQLIGYNYDASNDIYALSEMPIDPDKMIAISFDCLVSIVEIQIMSDIKTKCPDQMCWKDIYCIRCQYVCNVQSAVRIFCDLKRNNKLIDLDLDLDLPDYSMKTFNKIEQWSPTVNGSTVKPNISNNSSKEIILPPPPTYLESDLDTIDFIDSAHHNEQTSKNTTPINNTNFFHKDFKTTNNITAARKIIPVNVKPIHSEPQQIIISKKPIISPSNSSSFLYHRSAPNEKKATNPPTSTIRSISKENLLNNHHKPLIELSSEESCHQSSNEQCDDGWSCQSCTYVNDECVEICQMCHRSRTKGNESTPLITGGRQCNKCTLVNNKNDKFCTACGTSLADSPTYI
uniref:Uncharacterized protein LOC113795787 n=1 Tax=Dermatophagoides pteronyssinus TaxID=6956 RepID=A0A6P6Y926_DERPT|nr:uncharacterized protein LOC113795787 [Dermatophagoides pteronyssinus]